MAALVRGKIRLLIEFEEVALNAGSGDEVRQLHRVEKAFDFGHGTSNRQFDKVWSDQSLALTASSPKDLDLVAGSDMKDPAGGAISFAELGVIYIENLSSTSGQKVTLGNGGASSFNGANLAMPDDTSKFDVPPQGFVLAVGPLDANMGVVTPGTGDILRIDPGANTVAVRALLAGHSA